MEGIHLLENIETKLGPPVSAPAPFDLHLAPFG
jgi:hypothetical protein